MARGLLREDSPGFQRAWVWLLQNWEQQGPRVMDVPAVMSRSETIKVAVMIVWSVSSSF